MKLNKNYSLIDRQQTDNFKNITFNTLDEIKEVLVDRLKDSEELEEKSNFKIEYLENCDANGDYENLMYSQGYIQGLKDCLELLNRNKIYERLR